MPNCIMLFVPLCQFGIRYFDQLVRDRSIVELEDGLSKLVSLPLREEVDPYIVINTAQNKPFSLDSIQIKEKERRTYIPTLTAKYVPYQKLTSPPSAPLVGGYHGATNM